MDQWMTVDLEYYMTLGRAGVQAKFKRLRLIPAFVSADWLYLKFLMLIEESK